MNRSTILIPMLIAMVLMAVVLAASVTDQERFDQKERLQTFYRLSTIQSDLEHLLNDRLFPARTLRALVSGNPDYSQKDFLALTRQLTRDTPGILDIYMARDNRISHVYPPEKNEPQIGADVLQDLPAKCQPILRRAISGRTLHVSDPIPGENGDIIMAALPVHQMNFETGEDSYWGLIILHFDAAALFRQAHLNGMSTGLRIALKGVEDIEDVFTGDMAVFQHRPVVLDVMVPGNQWQVAAIPSKGWHTSPNRIYFWTGGIIATLLIALSSWAALFMLRGRINAQEAYRELVHNAKSIILRVNLQGNITFINEYALHFFGYQHNALLGKPLVGTLIPERDILGRNMRREVNEMLRNPMANTGLESTALKKNGEFVWISWTAKAVRDKAGHMKELLAVGTDITDRKNAEESLRKSERQFRLLAENITDSIWGVDANLNYTYISPSDSQMRGYDRTEILGQCMRGFVAPSSLPVLDRAVAAVADRLKSGQDPLKNLTLTLEMTRKEGGTLWTESRCSLFYSSGGELVGIQGVTRDITERKLSEALKEDMERMARHDLKTPLGAVIGLPEEILHAGPLTEEQRNMLTVIREAGEDMMALINRSLDLYKMELGVYSLKPKPLDLLELIGRIRTGTNRVIREKGVHFGVQILGQEDCGSFWAEGDPPLLHSMLSNLILNALQASKEGGTVTVELTRSDPVWITITNSGEVPKNVRSSFFDKYSRSANSSGSGLGTYSARLIATTHKGAIDLDTSVPGQTTVVVRLPAHQA